MKPTIIVFSGIRGTSPVWGLSSLARAFERLGYRTVTMASDDPGIKEKIRTLVSEEDVRFILSHNLKGWNIKYESGGKHHFFYDFFDKWLVSVIDTPLNKIDRIKHGGHKKILLFPDGSFLPLVRKVAPNGTVSEHLPMWVVDDCLVDAATEHSRKDVGARKIDVLWVGRVGANTAFVRRKANIIKSIATRSVLKKALYCQDKQIHDIFMGVQNRQWFLRHIAPFSAPYSAESLHFLWGLSNLVRARRRMGVLEELASLPTTVRLIVVSNNPEGISKMFKSNVELLPFQEWPKVVELMQDAKIVVNVQPFHIYGSHERLMTAMAHGAAVATDRNPYLEEHFEDDHNLIFYEFKKGHLRAKLLEYLGDLGRLRCVAQQAAEKVLKEDLAIHRAQDIIALVGRVSSDEEGKPETDKESEPEENLACR